eukprot:gene1875-5951_t
MDHIATDARKLGDRVGAVSEIRLCTDSQSAVRRLAAGAAAQRGPLTRDAWQALSRAAAQYGAHITVAYVCGHAGVEGNERADRLAGQASRVAKQEAAPIDLGTAAAMCRKESRERLERIENARATKDRDPLTKQHVWCRATERGRVRYPKTAREEE